MAECDPDGETAGEPPGRGPGAWSFFGERPGDRIGPYLLRTVLGEGGFGIVYLAERQEPHFQRVALKLIKLGMDSRAVIARFEQERQALAVMDHPNVAKVFDSGATDTGRPYFVMEYVPGEAITQYCDRHRLGVKARLRLAVQVCDAVQHAHTKGLVHRDLKPSNILVEVKDQGAIPKVIDFGVAKAMSGNLTDKTLMTEAGELIGTVEYMSPEQAEMSPLDIDTRADVYSLGVVLYELLTGLLPVESSVLRARPRPDVPRLLRALEPAKPSSRLSGLRRRATPKPVSAGGSGWVDPEDQFVRRGTDRRALIRALRGDLDSVLMHCLEKDRTRRYPTVSELAADIRLHLSNRPINARPASPLYRLRKFVRRNGVLVCGVAATMVALAGGLIAANNQATRAKVAEKLALAMAKSESDARRSAERDAEIARQTGEFLDGMIRASDPFVAGGPDVRARELVDLAAKHLERSVGMDPLVEAAVRKTVGATYRGLDLPALAEPQLQRSVALLETTAGAKTDDLFSARFEMGLTLVAQRRLDEAEPILSQYRDYVEHARKTGDDAAVTVLLELANFAQLRGDLKRAESLAREAVAGAESVPALTYADADAPRVLGSILVMAGRPTDALPYLADACANIETLEGTFTERWANTRAMYANALLETGGAAEAEKILKDNLELSEQMRGPDSLLALSAAGQLARAVDRNGRLDEAAALYLRSWQGLQKLLSDTDSRTMTAAGNYATLLAGQKRYAEALPLFESLAQARLANEGMASMNTLVAFNNLAGCKLRVEDYEGAAKTAGEALAVAQSALPEGSVYIGALHNNIGRALRKLGRYPEAEPHLLAAHAMLTKGFGPSDPRTIGMASELAALYEAWGKADAAQEWRDKAKPAETPSPGRG